MGREGGTFIIAHFRWFVILLDEIQDCCLGISKMANNDCRLFGAEDEFEYGVGDRS